MVDTSFAALKGGYRRLWLTMTIEPRFSHGIDAMCAKILAGMPRYRQVEDATGCPAHIVGIIHSLEGSCDFHTHLHNGDPLTARTRQVPRGRPLNGSPPFDWVTSAIDAIRLDKLDDPEKWATLEATAYSFERYNGMGYQLHPSFGTDSPYLWSYSNLYLRGKYRSDGQYDPHLASAQPGAMVLLRRLMELDASIAPQLEGAQIGPFSTEVIPEPPPAPMRADPLSIKAHPLPESVGTSKTVWALGISLLLQVAAWLKDWVGHAIDAATALLGVIPTAVAETKETLDAGELVAGWFKWEWAELVAPLAIAVLAVALIRYVVKKRGTPVVASTSPPAA